MNENINTIFYFPSTLTFEQYQNKLQSQEITPRTIVFAAALNAIYMGGRSYGSHTNTPEVEQIVRENAYDDSEIKASLNALDSALQDANRIADQEYLKLQNLLDNLNSRVVTVVDGLFDNPIWTGEKLPEGSNFGLQKVTEYLQLLGVWEQNEQTSAKNATWTKLSLRVNNIEFAVNHLWDNNTQNITNALQSKIDLSFDAKKEAAVAELSTMFAQKDAEDVLVWLYSGLTSQTSLNLTFNDLTSAAQNGLNRAIANIATLVSKLENGEYLATSSVESAVNNAIAGLATSATSNDAKTYIFNKIKKNEDDIDAAEDAISGLQDGFDGVEEDIAAIVVGITGDSSDTTIVNKLGTWKAGLITEANLEGASASLLTSNTDNTFKSGLKNYVKNNKALFELASSNDVTAASIVGTINALTNDSEITLNANHINLVGQTNFTSALADMFTANKFLAKAVHANGVPQFYEMMDAENGFDVGMVSDDWDWNKTYGENTNSGAWKNEFVHFHPTGQGELAGGVISWDNAQLNSNTNVHIGSNRGTVHIGGTGTGNSAGHVLISGNVTVGNDVEVHKLSASDAEWDGTVLEGSHADLTKDGLKIYRANTLIHDIQCPNGFYSLGGSQHVLTNALGNGTYSVDKVIAPTYNVIKYDNITLSSIDRGYKDGNDSISGITKVVNVGSTYMAIAGGIIICEGTQQECNDALAETWIYLNLNS